MPLKSGALTPQERLAAQAFADTGSAAETARRAGYSQPAAASRAIARPAVAAEVARIQQERLFNDVLPLAVDVHVALLTNPHTPAGAKVAAVKLAYDRTLGVQDGADRKSIEEMTPEELAAELVKIRQRKASLAREIDVEATTADPSGAGVLG